MIKITAQEFYSETRMELANKIGELKRDIILQMSKLHVFEDARTLEFNYSTLKSQLNVLVFIEYYLFNTKERNWLCTGATERPIQTVQKFKKVIQETMENILKKDPCYGTKWNSIYFITLHYLNRIEVQEDGT